MAEAEGANREFRAFLRQVPTLEEASSGNTTELTGVVTRVSDDHFAITTGDGKTYELEAQAVTRFRATDGPGLSSMVTIQVSSEVLKNAVLRPVKPIIKDLLKDPIKDIVHDGTLYAKDLFTDPLADKGPPHDTLAAKDVHTDPLADKHVIKDVHKDPIKDFAKDPIQDGVNKQFTDPVGTGAADVGNIPDPTGGIVNPFAAQFGGAQAMQQGAFTPFVMATPHHAPAHLLALQGGVQQAGLAGVGQQLKPFAHDTIKEIAIAETVKEPIRDTYKELVRDTYKELVYDTYWEGGPIYDPGPLATQPGFGMGGF